MFRNRILPLRPKLCFKDRNQISMNTMRKFSVLLLLVVGSTVSKAQQSGTESLFLNVGLTSTGLSSELGAATSNARVFDGDQGGGLTLKAGYGFSPLFTLYAGFNISGMERDGTDIPFWKEDDEYALTMFELGGRFNFREANHKLRPYAEVALTSTAAIFDDRPKTSAKGGAFSFGGGAQYFLSNVFALDAGLILSPGRFSEIVFIDNDVDVDDDGGFFATRFSVGLTVYPFQ